MTGRFSTSIILSMELTNQQILAEMGIQTYKLRASADLGVIESPEKILVVTTTDEKLYDKSKKLFTNMIEAIKLKSENIYFYNLETQQQATDLLTKKIQQTNVDVVLLLGKNISQFILKTELPLNKLRQKTHILEKTQIPIIAIQHPNELLKNSKNKASAWLDLQLIQKIINKTK